MSALALLDCVGWGGGWARVWFGDPGEPGDLRGHSGTYGVGSSEDRGDGTCREGKLTYFLVPLLVAFSPVKIPIDSLNEKHTD